MRKLSLLLALCLLISLLPAAASAATVIDSGTCGENLTWTLDSDGLLTISGTGDMVKEEGQSVWGWTNYMTSKVRSVVVGSGVTSIGERAFSTGWSLNSVTLPDSVKCIYDNAFNNCFMLKEIRIPAELEYLEVSAFSECSRIEKYTVPKENRHFKNDAAGALYSMDGTVLYALPANFSGEYAIADGVKVLYPNTFLFHNDLTGLYIPASVETIEENAIYSCINLKAFRVSSENPYYEHDENGLLYTKGKLGLVRIPGAKTGTVTLADTTVWIEPYAANNCSWIQEIILPHTLEIIERYAFNQCSRLEKINLPDKLSFIGRLAFYHCEKLNQISIPGSVKLVSEDAFNGCYALETVEIQSGVEIIGSYAFAWCKKLESISLPESVQRIYSGAFSGCEALKEVRLPESIKQIDGYVFNNCPLITVNYAGIPRQWEQVTVATWGNDPLLNAKLVFSRNDENFNAEEDGWSIPNHELCYGYYDSDFFIGFYEYFVTGTNLSSYVNAWWNTSRKSWSGNCFGMSLLAAAHYNGQIDLREFFDKEGDCLNEFGYESIQQGPQDHVLSGSFYSLAGNEELLQLIERAQVSRYSSDIADAEVFKGDKDFSGLLEYLNGDSPAPLVVSMDTAKHAVVTDTSYKPVDMGGGVYAIMCYDCNAPSLSSPLKNSAEIYNRKKTYILLNTNNGKWSYFYNGKEKVCSEYYSGYVRNIRFYDPSLLNKRFFDKMYTLSTDFSVFFEAQNLTVNNVAGDVIFEMVDGVPTACAENVYYVAGTYGLNLDSNSTLSYLALPEGSYTYTSSGNSYIMQLSGDCVAFLELDSECSATVDPETKKIVVRKASETTPLTLKATVGNGEGTVIVTLEGKLAEGTRVSISTDTRSKTAEVATDGDFLDLKASATVDGEVREDRLQLVHLHSWNEWEQTKEPNYLENGEKVRSCKVCGESETGVVENNPFTDVGEGNRFKTAILWAYYNNITAGKTATTFAPETDVTRAQFVTFLWRAAGEPEPASYENPFTDVPDGKYYTEAVLWAYYAGITAGTTETTFEPSRICSRGQVVMFLYRYAGEPVIGEVENPFTDVGSGNRYYKAIMWAYSNNITSGKTATTFQLGSSCYRSHVVTFLYRYLA